MPGALRRSSTTLRKPTSRSVFDAATASACSASLASGALVAQLVLARAARDSFVLAEYGLSALPRLSALSACLSVIALLIASRVTALFGPARALAAGVALNAACIVVELPFASGRPGVLAAVMHVHFGVLAAPLVSTLWSLVSERFDPHGAKRVIGWATAGGALGGVVGGGLGLLLVGSPLTRILQCLLALNVIASLAISFVDRRKPTPAGAPVLAHHDVDFGASIRSALMLPYLRRLAALVGVVAMTESLLDYLFAARLGSTSLAALELFGMFHMGVSMASVLVVAIAGRAALNHLGLGGSVAMVPAASLLGGVVGLAVPGLAPAVLGRGLHGVMRSSLFRSAYEILFTPLDARQKRRVKVLIDVGFDRIGAVLGSALVIAVVEVAPAMSERVLFGVLALFGAAALALARSIGRQYVTALEDSLRRGAYDPRTSPAIDATTRWAITQTQIKLDREELLREIARLESEPQVSNGVSAPPPATLLGQIAALVERDPAGVGPILDARPVDARLVPHFIALLADESYAPAVIRTLASAPHVTGQLVDALVDPNGEVVVRCRIPRILARTPIQRGVDGLVAALSDESGPVRRAAAAALTHAVAKEPSLSVNRMAVIAAVLREIAGPEVPAHRDHFVALVALAVRPIRVRRALEALRGSDATLRGTAIEYLIQVLPSELRRPVLGILADGRATAHPSVRIAST